MSDSFKKYEEWKEGKTDDDRHTVTSLRQDIERLQRDISKLYTEELFMSRVRVSELEQKVAELEAENALLLKQSVKQDKQEFCSGEDDDWYTTHGQGD